MVMSGWLSHSRQTAGHSRGGLRQYSGTAVYRQLDIAEVAYANIQVQLLTDR
jgi:hypothetical protein